MNELWIQRTRRANGRIGRIVALEVAKFQPSSTGGRGTLTAFEWYPINVVIKALLDGATAYTCTPALGLPDTLNKGAQVHPYLTSDANGKPGDNLDNLPIG